MAKLFPLFFLSVLTAYGQIVETVATHPKIKDGLHSDPSGNIYTSSGGLVNGREIGRFNPISGVFDAFFANGFFGPIDIEDVGDSVFFVTNYDVGTISKLVLSTGVVSSVASGLDGPAGIAKDEQENLYITNWGAGPSFDGSSIHKLTPQGNLTKIVDTSLLYRPQAVIVNLEGELVVHSQKKLFKVNLQTFEIEHWVNLPVHLGNMVLREKDSSIYGAANQDHKICKVDYYGNATIFSGGNIGYQDGSIDQAQFNSPLGITFTPSEDTMYIAETNPGRLRRVLMNLTLDLSEENRKAKEKLPKVTYDLLSHIIKVDNYPINLESLRLLDISGAYRGTIELNNGSATIDTQLFPRGVYFLLPEEEGRLGGIKLLIYR